MTSTSPPKDPPVASQAGPWTLRSWTALARSWVTASCAVCGAVPWDEALGMCASFDSTEQAREELPRDWGWVVTVLPGGADRVLCPRCAARPGTPS